MISPRLDTVIVALLYLINYLSVAVRKDEFVSWNAINVDIKNKTILNVKKGSLYGSRIVGILGPSGSGKTTFLNVIAKKIKSGHSIYKLKTDLKRHYDEKASDVAFIYQDDHFFSMMTVQETLYLSGLLKLGTNLSTADVDYVLETLDLKKIASSPIGDINRRGISGGERKRLSVAAELLGNPKILLADEPTSGLDSFQAYSVMMHLSTLSKQKNICILCSIHQPRSSIWNLFDDILLLSQGQVVYFGPRDKILSYFSSLGHICPPNTNPAEFLIDLVSKNSSTIDSLKSSKERLQTLIHAYDQHHTSYTDMMHNLWPSSLSLSSTEILSPPVHETTDSDLTTSSSSINDVSPYIPPPPSSFSSSTLPSSLITKTYTIKSKMKQITHFLYKKIRQSSHRMSYLLLRAFRQSIRDMSTNAVRFLTSCVLAVIVSSVYGKPTGSRLITEASVSSRVNILAQAVVNIGMMSVVKTLQIIKKEKVIIDRERCGGQYNAMEYLITKSMIEMPLDAIFATVFAAVLHRQTDIHMPVTQLLYIISLFSITCSSYGLAIGSLFPQAEVALALGPAISVVYIILGVFGPSGIKSESIPAVLKPIRTISPMRWACEALCIAEFQNQPFSNPMSSNTKTQLLITNEKKNIVTLIRDQLVSKPRVIIEGIKTGIKYVFNSTFRQQYKDIKQKKLTEGDIVLQSFGIQAKSVYPSIHMLYKLIGGHFLIALVGLIFQPKHN